MSESIAHAPTASAALSVRVRQFYALTKPRVVQLIVFCAVIGMLMASPGLPDWKVVIAATIGIWLVAAAAAAFNCLVEQHIDAQMKRTAWRPTARGELGNGQTLAFAALRGEVGPEALMLCLIIFLWTPPHFWALALYRAEDYARAGLPMLPVTHGNDFTRLQILLYTFVLFAATLLPFIYRMSGWIYLLAAVALGAGFCGYAFALWRRYSEALARRTFRFSIWHLSLLFAALLLDHYLTPLLRGA